MAKYDGLRLHMRRQSASELEMSFADIEHRIGAWLPKGALQARWWANDEIDRGRCVQSHAWLSAGYRAHLLSSERVRFGPIA